MQEFFLDLLRLLQGFYFFGRESLQLASSCLFERQRALESNTFPTHPTMSPKGILVFSDQEHMVSTT